MSAMVRIFDDRWKWSFGTFHLSPNENILTIAGTKSFIISFI
jgi:hypothetical protein